MQFYLYQEEGEAIGPFDVLAMMKKIRGGIVHAGTLITTGKYGEPMPAASVEELLPFFEADPEEDMVVPAPSARVSAPGEKTLSAALAYGFSFLQTNVMALVYGGCILLGIVFLMLPVFTFFPSEARTPFFFIAYTLSIFLFLSYFLVIFRMVRGQSADWQEMVQFVIANYKTLLAISAIVAVTSVIGFVLLVVPGLFVFTLFVYSPIYLYEQRGGFWASMDASRRFVMSNGSDHMGVIFALVVINIIAGLLVAPLLLTLPVTLSALVDIYEDADFK